MKEPDIGYKVLHYIVEIDVEKGIGGIPGGVIGPTGEVLRRHLLSMGASLLDASEGDSPAYRQAILDTTKVRCQIYDSKLLMRVLGLLRSAHPRFEHRYTTLREAKYSEERSVPAARFCSRCHHPFNEKDGKCAYCGGDPS